MRQVVRRELSKRDLVVVALFLQGGATRKIELEDVAMKAHELAPTDFSWKSYAEQVDKDLVRVLLFDARKEAYGSLVTGRAGAGWMLTERGLVFAQKALKRLPDLRTLGDAPLLPGELRRRGIERERLEASDAYRKALGGHVADVTPLEAESFFRLNAYITGEARQRKVDQILNMFADDQELTQVIRAVALKVQR